MLLTCKVFAAQLGFTAMERRINLKNEASGVSELAPLFRSQSQRFWLVSSLFRRQDKRKRAA
jgi:hypothetical protein